jgi:hypothetical protein
MSNIESLLANVKKSFDWSKQHVNYKMGLIGGGVGGAIAFAANHEHGFWPATFAFGKQFLYVTFAGGFNLKLCEKMAKRFDSRTLSVGASTIAPMATAAAIMYGVHKLGGTPNAEYTTALVSALNFPFLLSFGIYYRRKHERESCRNL